MKITIVHRRDRRKEYKYFFFGLFKSVVETEPIYCVDTTIEFSEEERAIIATYDLWDTPLYTHRSSPTKYEQEYYRDTPDFLSLLASSYTSTVKSIMEKPVFTICFPTPAQANAYEEQLRTDILPKLKQLIQSNSAPTPESKSFEL